MNIMQGTLRASSDLVQPRRSALSPVSALQSDTIKVARVLCILFMMSTHAWPGSERILAAGASIGSTIFHFVLVDLLGRASVPLLSFVSGWLFVYSFSLKSPRRLIADKARTLLLPMMIWSIPMVVVLLAKQKLGFSGSPLPTSTLDWLNLFFALTAAPANGPLHFLREIFIMALYGSVILLVIDRSKVAGCLLALGVVLIEQIPGGLLLFRNTVATMFVAGLLVARFNRSHWVPSWLLVGAALVFFASGKFHGWLVTTPETVWAFRISEHIPKLALALFAWRLAHEVASRRNPIRNFCLKLEPHIFVVFCSHALIATFFGLLASVLTWSEGDAYYPLLLVTQLVTFCAAGIALSHILAPLPWLCGKPGSSFGAMLGLKDLLRVHQPGRITRHQSCTNVEGRCASALEDDTPSESLPVAPWPYRA